MNDYQRIASAIDFLEARLDVQPALQDLAEHLALHPHTVQKLFSRWAGVSPKQFLQALTVEKAKYLLQAEALSVLETSEQLGLSSASRLYDHFVTLEAVTPGEYRCAGEAMQLTYGLAPSPYGEVLIAFSERGICEMSYVDAETAETIITRLKTQWHRADFARNDALVCKQVQRIFTSKKASAASPLKLCVQGTNFQIAVWRALLKIPCGAVVAYGDIAAAVQRPKAVRAVGTAVGANPISLLIPCHRVIRQSGALGGYRGGLTRKKAILLQELPVA